MSMIFQSYALWPHMTVFENIAYGLRLRGLAKSELQRRADTILAATKLSALAQRYPGALSGGQQQRVSLARALVIEPEILLLDEPLSNLDANLREEMRFEIRRLHDKYRYTTVYVTHDQAEAMTTANLIVVMNQGAIEQAGSPEDIYQKPAHRVRRALHRRHQHLQGALGRRRHGRLRPGPGTALRLGRVRAAGGHRGIGAAARHPAGGDEAGRDPGQLDQRNGHSSGLPRPAPRLPGGAARRRYRAGRHAGGRVGARRPDRLAAFPARALPGAGDLTRPRPRTNQSTTEHQMSIPSKQQNEHLTRYVAEFICNTRLADLPADVVALGKKSILDGLGLALSGGATHLGEMVRRHFSDLHLGRRPGHGDRLQPEDRAALRRVRQRRGHPRRRL